MKANTATPGNSRDLVVYFALAYAISWAIGIPLALAAQGLMPPMLPKWLHYFVAYGPVLSAVIVTWVTRGQSGLKELWGRIAKWNIGGVWWLVALSPLILGAILALGLALLANSKVSLAQLGDVNFLPPLGIGALFLWLFTFGLGEEVGWRGFALPRLQKNHNALQATIILAVFWALWHLPQFFYLFEPSIAIGWLIGLFAGAIVFTWLFNSTQGSILAVAVWHGCFNFISASNAGNGFLAAAISTIVMIWAVVVVLLYKPKNLSHKDRFTL